MIFGVKAIITGALHMHELLVMSGWTLTAADADYAVCCAVPVDVENLTLIARLVGRPSEAAATFSVSGPGRLLFGASPEIPIFIVERTPCFPV